MRRIAVLSTGRQDWGILRSTCRALQEDPGFELRLLLGGMHCASRFGLTRRLVEEEGFQAAAALSWIPEDREAPVHEQAGAATVQVGAALGEQRPEALLLAGDRFETAAAALAATVARVPIIHLHGGEETEGAFDNALRHAISKMSHLHLTSHPDYAARLVGMGEDPASVHVVGAPGLDNLHRTDLPGREELEAWLGLALAPPVVLVTLHPATLGADPAVEADAVLAAMEAVPATYVVTLPNVDPGAEAIRSRFLALRGRPRTAVVEALGEQRYWGMMRLADAMLGNSSSALLEAPLAGLPAVNIGDRQKNRLRGRNVLDAAPEPQAVTAALRRALTAEQREEARRDGTLFGEGRSALRILQILREWSPPSPPVKRTYSPPATGERV